MAKQFQHTAQRAYLERWKVEGCLYLYDKSLGQFAKKQSAKSILGMENMQSEAMEKAFCRVEECIGHTTHVGEMKDERLVRSFAEWMALHLVRNALNASELFGKNYAAEVQRLSLHLGAHFGFWMDFTGDVFITGDNPVVPVIYEGETFYVAALSPRRCVYLVAEDKIPGEGGKQALMPPRINRLIHDAATKYCVSFDRELHI